MQQITIDAIPAVLWNDEPYDRLFIAVHGNMSSKTDTVIRIFAEEAVRAGYQVLSFDLPGHGERRDAGDSCTIQDSVADLERVLTYAKTLSHDIGVFACSMGAYFSLTAYRDEDISASMFLSPVVDMRALIESMMAYENVSVKELEEKKVIRVPDAQPLDWEYYQYVCTHPVRCLSGPTYILCGEYDTLSSVETVAKFVKGGDADVSVMNGASHYFHTEEELDYFRNWIARRLMI